MSNDAILAVTEGAGLHVRDRIEQAVMERLSDLGVPVYRGYRHTVTDEARPSVAEWVDQNLPLVKLQPYQQEIIDASSEPGVEVRIVPCALDQEAERLLELDHRLRMIAKRITAGTA